MSTHFSSNLVGFVGAAVIVGAAAEVIRISVDRLALSSPFPLLLIRTVQLLPLSPDNSETGLSGRMTDIGNLDRTIGNNPVDNAVGISCRQERPVSLKGIEHGWSHLGKVAQKVELGNDLILNHRGEALELFLSPWQEFNLSWHALLFWP